VVGGSGSTEEVVATRCNDAALLESGAEPALATAAEVLLIRALVVLVSGDVKAVAEASVASSRKVCPVFLRACVQTFQDALVVFLLFILSHRLSGIALGYRTAL
jgi:hypothetical protein